LEIQPVRGAIASASKQSNGISRCPIFGIVKLLTEKMLRNISLVDFKIGCYLKEVERYVVPAPIPCSSILAREPRSANSVRSYRRRYWK